VSASPSLPTIAFAISGEETPATMRADAPWKMPASCLATVATTVVDEFLDSVAKRILHA